MEPRSIAPSFATLFPSFHQDVQKLVQQWRYQFLRVARLGMYLGKERLLALTMFGHKLILNTSDFHSLKPLYHPTPSDLTLCALFNVMHTPHSQYLFIHPSHAFHLFQPGSFKSYGSLRVIDTEKGLFDIAQNWHLNEIETDLMMIHSSYWQRNPHMEIAPPLQCLEPYLEYTPSSVHSSFDDLEKLSGFQYSMTSSNASSLEELLSHDFMNMRAVIFDRASFAQLQEDDLKSFHLLNPSCCFLVYLCAQEKDPVGVKFRLAQAQNLGYHIWQLPHFKPLEVSRLQMPLFGRWVLLTTNGFI